VTLYNLNRLYHHQLQDLYSACQQSMDAAAKLADAASNEELKDLLVTGAKGFGDGMEKLRSICELHRIDAVGVDCKGVRALITEMQFQALDAEFSDDATRDTMIIMKYQRIVHYTVTGYSCIVAFANRLELEEDARVLKKQLTEINEGVRQLSRVASGYLNVEAA